MDQFHGLFVKLDQNKDGFVSVAELHEEMRKHGIISADTKAQVRFLFMFNLLLLLNCFKLFNKRVVFLQSIISSYDKDNDGLLDYKEFLIYMRDREKKWKIHFHDLDKNNCGE